MIEFLFFLKSDLFIITSIQRASLALANYWDSSLWEFVWKAKSFIDMQSNVLFYYVFKLTLAMVCSVPFLSNCPPKKTKTTAKERKTKNLLLSRAEAKNQPWKELWLLLSWVLIYSMKTINCFYYEENLYQNLICWNLNWVFPFSPFIFYLDFLRRSPGLQHGRHFQRTGLIGSVTRCDHFGDRLWRSHGRRVLGLDVSEIGLLITLINNHHHILMIENYLIAGPSPVQSASVGFRRVRQELSLLLDPLLTLKHRISSSRRRAVNASARNELVIS